MIEPTTLQELLVQFLDPAGLNGQQRKVCQHLMDCRTETLGGLSGRCDRCGAERPRWRSCGDRHCPQCQGRATEQWCERQGADQLPVPYFHLVFTLPHRLDPWVQAHPEVIYRTLFRSVWTTLNRFGEDPKRLGGQLGMTGVLHTWGQSLCRHVHLHCLVPGGALSKDGTWTPVKGSYLFPVRALSRHVRGHMVSALRAAANNRELTRIDPAGVKPMLDALMSEDWVVYAKPCLEHTDSVVQYLAGYTHRIALSNARLLGRDGDQVSLAYRDYHDGQNKTMELEAPELIRRFVLHILPKGLTRVRHYGLLANRCRVQRLAQIRELLDAPVPDTKPDPATPSGEKPEPGWPCPVCRSGRMRAVREIPPCRAARAVRRAPYR
jgi:hypothetical protein